MGFSVDAAGALGFRRYRSHDVLAVDECLIAHPLVTGALPTPAAFPPGERVEVAASTSTGETSVTVGNERGKTLHERAADARVAGDRRFLAGAPRGCGCLGQRCAGTFCNLKPASTCWICIAVSAYLRVPIADAVGVGGRVDAVESSAQAVRDARVNIGGSSQVHLHHLDVPALSQRDQTAKVRWGRAGLSPSGGREGSAGTGDPAEAAGHLLCRLRSRSTWGAMCRCSPGGDTPWRGLGYLICSR